MPKKPDHHAASGLLRGVGAVHGRLVHGRRVTAIANAIAPLMSQGQSLLDIGCGDGTLAAQVNERVGNLQLTGLEVIARPQAAIPVTVFDGQHIPLDDNTVDVAMMVDVLHHTHDPMILLREAARVARSAVIIKDHRMERPLAGLTLRFMDWVGNKPHGVTLPYNYWNARQWSGAWKQLSLTPDQYQTRLGLYPAPANWLFESGLHFVARLRPEQAP
ncbi:MAG: class I SAM-dependent methyltransferase [Phycisphaeraceae bacterium]